jgi:hypothetical protein
MSLIKNCMNEKTEILTSQAAVTHPGFRGEGKPTGKRAVQPGYRAECGVGECRERCSHRCHRKQSRNIDRLLVVSSSTSTTWHTIQQLVSDEQSRKKVNEQIYLVGSITALNRTFPLATLSYALLISCSGNISVITFTLPFAT